MKRFFGLLLVFATLVSILSGCGGGESSTSTDGGGASNGAASGTPVVIKFVHAGAIMEGDPQHEGALYFEKILEERSNGYYDVQVFGSTQLGDTVTKLEGIQSGTIEMGDIESGPTVSFVPAEALWDMPYMFVSWDHAHDSIDGELGNLVKEKWKEIGIDVLGYNDGGFRHFSNSKRPIYTPEDLKGMKIRTMESETMVDSLNTLGCSAMPLAFGEVYSALQQGAIDGVETPYNLIFSQAYYEVEKYISPTGHFFFLRHYLANSNWLASQPADMQELIRECALDACAKQREMNYEAQQKYKKDLVTEYGMELNEVDIEPFMKIAREQVWPKYYGRIGELLGDGTEESGKAIMDSIVKSSQDYEIDLA
jgi:tripartite ATP-independent transporter DctP family solute receptor